MIYGCDVSYSNGLPNWSTPVKYKLVEFAFNRACYGTNPADDDGASFVHNHDALKALGVPSGAYQFYLFGQDGKAQAEHLLQAIGGREGELVPPIDVEEGSAAQGDGGSIEQRIENLAAYSDAIVKGLGCKPMICTNQDTWARFFGNSNAFAGHLLWVMARISPTGPIPMPGGWARAAVLQYSDTGKFIGFDGAVDLDVLVDETTIADIMRP